MEDSGALIADDFDVYHLANGETVIANIRQKTTQKRPTQEIEGSDSRSKSKKLDKWCNFVSNKIFEEFSVCKQETEQIHMEIENQKTVEVEWNEQRVIWVDTKFSSDFDRFGSEFPLRRSQNVDLFTIENTTTNYIAIPEQIWHFWVQTNDWSR